MRILKVITFILLLINAEKGFSQYETINLPIEINRFGGNVTSFITNQDNPFIYSTTNGASTFPFTELGHLVIQPRTSTLRDILFVTGNGTGIRMAIKGNGNIGIGTTTPTVKTEILDGQLAINGSVGYDFQNKWNSQGSLWSANVGLSSIILNGEAGDRPEISFYRGTRPYPEFAIREHSTADKGGTIYSGSGLVAPTATMSFKLGNVGIGTINPQSKLAVNGTITSTEVIVTTEGWSDFVFNKDYKLKDLEEVESYIEENNHLPDIPSEKEVQENGIQLGEMDAKLLQKIEELTLYMIEQNKKTDNLIEKVETLESENIELKEKITKLEIAE
ncbi:MAG: hypothetical protein JEY96_19355 [Bacteroidales bacterium]|nr:hypothetical protein [Bacteroidales bacterium]